MKKTLLSIAIATATITSLPAMAYTNDAVSTAGVTTQRTEIGVGSSNDHVTEYGAFYNYGNKMTGEAGYIYNAGGQIEWGQNNGIDSRTYDVNGDLGYRFELDKGLYADVVTGVGYERLRYKGDSNSRDEVSLPYAKAGGALMQKFNSYYTGRLEVGTRYNFNSDVDSRSDFGRSNNDLDSKHSMYVEASLLATNTDLPLEFTVFHRKGDLEFDGSGSQLDRDVTGLKAGVQF